MFWTANNIPQNIRFSKPDMIDMVYIQQLEKKAVSKERIRMIFSAVGMIICIVMIFCCLGDSVGKVFIPMIAVVLIGCAGAFLLFLVRMYYAKGVPEEYGILKGTVFDMRVRVRYRRNGLNKRDEYVDVMFEDGSIYRDVYVFKSTTDVMTMDYLATKFTVGDPVKIIKINSRTIYAVS